ncbi:hypothetical protein [Neobacillus sp. D3-1R]|uniref:hypothetical protein n=1 Tax=Neobacillus sp. D3-1R TaxID=3445778 RepID=UPI003F9F971A
MTLWMLLLIFSVTLILFGVFTDFIAKKKGYRFERSNGSKNTSEADLILKQAHLNQVIGNVDSPNP